ncbi:hypothetical protein H0H93_001749, partial [Arthromyces matolae]
MLIKRAEKQPDVYLRDVMRKCTENGVNTFSHPQILRLLVDQLKPFSAEASLEEKSTAAEALLGITMALAQVTDERAALALDQGVAQAWPKIWEWMKDSLREVEITSPGDPEAWMRRQELVANMLGFLFRKPMTKATIAKTEDVLGLVMDMYLNLSKGPPILPARDTIKSNKSPV